MCYRGGATVVMVRDMVKERWWSATNINAENSLKHVLLDTCTQQCKYMYCSQP